MICCFHFIIDSFKIFIFHQFLKVGGSFFSLREAIFEMWAEWAIGFTRKLMVLGQGIFHRFVLVHFDLGKLLFEVIW